jgi:predicted AlkP superfamily pyrophosphatase or phosphodiesterase
VGYDRVILVVLDGLRPDAIRPDVMPALTTFSEKWWRATHTVTVTPSVTVAALTSLATGVGPATHRLTEPGLRVLGMFSGLTLLPGHLRRHGRSVAIVTTDLPAPNLVVARTLLGVAGAGRIVPGGTRPSEVAGTAIREARQGPGGLTVVYLNDCDRAGHAEGWMSPWYLSEAARLDDAVAVLAPLALDDDTLIIFTADHGGGGLVPHDHDGDHPLNLRIPLLVGGRRVMRGSHSQRPAHLLDIPPTILSAFGIPVPSTFEGRILHEAFAAESEVAVA